MTDWTKEAIRERAAQAYTKSLQPLYDAYLLCNRTGAPKQLVKTMDRIIADMQRERDRLRPLEVDDDA